MQNRINHFLGTILGAVMAVIVFIFGEGFIIYFVTKFGFFKSTLLLTPIFILVELLVYKLYTITFSRNRYIFILQNKIKKLESNVNDKWKIVARSSKILAVLLCGVVSGIIITPVFIGVLGIRTSNAIALLVLSALAFTVCWAGIYSGIFRIFKLF